ncbi:MAG TPA: hypothetical protein VK789_29270 [Bryobacteraceae bacterium]|nr:hypothetical protein [Bryobacteraceae bacterium]
MTTGRTLEETKANIQEAIVGHIQTLRAFGDPIPEPTRRTEEIAVTTAARS